MRGHSQRAVPGIRGTEDSEPASGERSERRERMAPMPPIDYIEPGPGRGMQRARGRHDDVEAARTKAVGLAIRPPDHCRSPSLPPRAWPGLDPRRPRGWRPIRSLPASVRSRPVLEQVVNGDLVMAGNSNLLSAGGWRAGDVTIADVDSESTEVCIIRGVGFPRACADNSSSARLDLPRGARVIEARLYVQTTVAADVGPLRVRLDGPDESVQLHRPGRGDARRAGSSTRRAAAGRWRAVAAGGVGRHGLCGRPRPRRLHRGRHRLRAGRAVPPVCVVGDRRRVRVRRAQRRRSSATCRSASSNGSRHAPCPGTTASATSPKAPSRCRSAGSRSRRRARSSPRASTSSATASAATPTTCCSTATRSATTSPRATRHRLPVSSSAGHPACNSTTDVQNDTVCVLGKPVASKRPGRRAYIASGDGRTRSSGSGVDIDVIRIPDRYLLPGSTAASLSIQVTGSDALAPGMLAVSVDLPVPAVPPAVTR